MHDIFQVLKYLDERSCFARDSSLNNIVDRVFADTLVEADIA